MTHSNPIDPQRVSDCINELEGLLDENLILSKTSEEMMLLFDQISRHFTFIFTRYKELQGAGHTTHEIQELSASIDVISSRIHSATRRMESLKLQLEHHCDLVSTTTETTAAMRRYTTQP